MRLALNSLLFTLLDETHYHLRGRTTSPGHQEANKRLAMATNIQDKGEEGTPSRHLQNRNRNRARNNARRRRRRRNRNRRRRRRRNPRNSLFGNNRQANRSWSESSSTKTYVRQSSNSGGCSGVDGSICAIFYTGGGGNGYDDDGYGGGGGGGGGGDDGYDDGPAQRSWVDKKRCCDAVATGKTPAGFRNPNHYCYSLGFDKRYC